MSFDYTDMAATSARLLGSFGKATAYIRTKGSSYNTTTGVVADTSSDASVNAVQVKYNEFHSPGAQIKSGDIFWVLDGRPTVNDELYIGGYTFDVVQTWPIVPGDTFIACRCQTRAGVLADIPDPSNVINGTDNVINGTDNVVSG